MQTLKTSLLWLLSLIALMLCSVLALKIMDMVLTLDNTNIWSTGLKSGLLAWVIMAGILIFRRSTGDK